MSAWPEWWQIVGALFVALALGRWLVGIIDRKPSDKTRRSSRKTRKGQSKLGG